MRERLQKLIAQAGITSRRAAEDLIKAGQVTVNGTVVTELGSKADPETDHIKVRGKLINRRLKEQMAVCIVLNKPKGVLSSASDAEGRKLVTDLIRGFGRLHPVGRLDYNSEGLILVTNDGELSNLVASSKRIPKIYEVKVKGIPPRAAINKLRRGVRLDDGFVTAPAEIAELPATDKNGWYEVTLYEGHNQQIRKMFDSIGHSVVKLRRVAIGNLRDPYLRPGSYRKLSPEEVNDLREFKGIMRSMVKTTRPRRSPAGRNATPKEGTPVGKARRSTKPSGQSGSGARPSGKGPGRP